MNAGEFLDLYGEISQLSQKMLESARNGDWDGLLEVEKSRFVLVERLEQQEKEGVWEPGEQNKKAALIQNILDADTETRTLTEAWMAELQEILGSIGTERKLHKTYEAP